MNQPDRESDITPHGTVTIVCAHPGDESFGLDALRTFDRGITDHPDHEQATKAAVTADRPLGVSVWGWATPGRGAVTLRDEFDIPFADHSAVEADLTMAVDRSRQRQVFDCPGSQVACNPVPHRRIELQGAAEALRLLYDPTS